MRVCNDWLYDFIGDHLNFIEPNSVAEDLRDQLQQEIGGASAPASIVQFATFARMEGVIVPEFWHITNIHGMTEAGYDPPSDTFKASERLLGVHLQDHATPQTIREFLKLRARQFQPFWFHQGFALPSSTL